MRGTGILLTPAPARPMARTDSGSGMSCMLAERTRTASGMGNLGGDLVAVPWQPVQTGDGDVVQGEDLVHG